MPRNTISVAPVAGRPDASAPAFACSCVERDLQAAWVAVAGALDRATAPQLQRTLHEAQLQAHLVVLDLRELTSIDSSGRHAIASASLHARRLGRRLVLMRGSPSVDRAFTLTGSSDDVEIGDFDLDPVALPVLALQRSLVSSSLLKTGERARSRGHTR